MECKTSLNQEGLPDGYTITDIFMPDEKIQSEVIDCLTSAFVEEQGLVWESNDRNPETVRASFSYIVKYKASSSQMGLFKCASRISGPVESVALAYNIPDGPYIPGEDSETEWQAYQSLLSDEVQHWDRNIASPVRRQVQRLYPENIPSNVSEYTFWLATAPSGQRKGLAKALVQSWKNDIATDDWDSLSSIVCSAEGPLYRSQGFSHVARSCFYGPPVEGASSTAFIWDMLLLDSRKAKHERSTATKVAEEAEAEATEVEGE